MLKLASLQDYPELFNSHKIEAVLSEDELNRFRLIQGYRQQQEWLLRRILIKDLALHHLSVHEHRYYPLNAMEVRKGGQPRQREMHCLLMQHEEPLFHVWSASDGDVAVGLLMPPLSGLRAGLHVRHVERGYPYVVDNRFTAQEEDLLRSLTPSHLHPMTTTMLEVKSLCAEIFPEAKAPFAIHHIDGDDRVHLDWTRLDLPQSIDRSYIQSWAYEDVIIVLAFFYVGDHGGTFIPQHHVEWV